MKVLFLDIDGVLNTHKSVGRYGIDFIDYILLKLIRRIVNETDCKIILSSSWRLDPKDRSIVDREFATEQLVIHDVTPYLSRLMRKDEINQYLANNSVSKFAIIDDDKDADVGHSFFHTDCNVGLTAKMADAIIDHLKD